MGNRQIKSKLLQIRYIESAITMPSEIREAINQIKNWRYSTVAKFARASTLIKRFLETNEEIQNSWAKKLKDLKLPNQPVVSLSKRGESYSLLDQLVSRYLLDQFDNLKPSNDRGKIWEAILDELSQLGSYMGLVVRYKIHCERLKSPRLTRDEADSLASKIEVDVNRLVDLYGAIGYVEKGYALQMLADYYLDFDRESEFKFGENYYEAGIKNYLCAYLLHDHPYSNAMIASLTKDQGIADLFDGDSIDFSDRDKIKRSLLDLLGGDEVIFQKLLKQAKDEIDDFLAKEQSKLLGKSVKMLKKEAEMKVARQLYAEIFGSPWKDPENPELSEATLRAQETVKRTTAIYTELFGHPPTETLDDEEQHSSTPKGPSIK